MALNQAAENSVLAESASGNVASDGTGRQRFSCLQESLLMKLGVIQLDPWLSPFKDSLRSRFSKAQQWLKTIDETEGGMDRFTRGFEKFGFTFSENGDITYREWAPNAEQAFLIGDFNNWNREATPMKRDPFGVWEVFLPAKDGVPAIAHNTKAKISMIIPGGERIERVSPWITRVTQDLNESPVYDAVLWHPPENERYVFKHPRPKQPVSVRIYEAHVGISSPETRVATYKEFTKNMIP